MNMKILAVILISLTAVFTGCTSGGGSSETVYVPVEEDQDDIVSVDSELRINGAIYQLSNIYYKTEEEITKISAFFDVINMLEIEIRYILETRTIESIAKDEYPLNEFVQGFYLNTNQLKNLSDPYFNDLDEDSKVLLSAFYRETYDAFDAYYEMRALGLNTDATYMAIILAEMVTGTQFELLSEQKNKI